MSHNKHIDYSRAELSKSIGLSYRTIWYREEKLGILNKKYTDARLFKIKNYVEIVKRKKIKNKLVLYTVPKKQRKPYFEFAYKEYQSKINN